MDLSGGALRELREAAGLSQSELARRTGLHQPVLSAYEAGRREPRASAISRIVTGSGHRLTIAATPDGNTLAGIVEQLIDDGELDDRELVWRVFVHSFGRNRWRTFEQPQREAALLTEPRRTGSRTIDSLAAAVARWLSTSANIAEPPWVKTRVGTLTHRWYPGLFSTTDARRRIIDDRPEPSFAAFNIWVDPDDLPPPRRED